MCALFFEVNVSLRYPCPYELAISFSWLIFAVSSGDGAAKVEGTGLVLAEDAALVMVFLTGEALVSGTG